MTKVLINNTTMTDIANAIREKTGENTKFFPHQMGEAIKTITSNNNPELFVSLPKQGIRQSLARSRQSLRH